jgi:hypothetical protein
VVSGPDDSSREPPTFRRSLKDAGVPASRGFRARLKPPRARSVLPATQTWSAKTEAERTIQNLNVTPAENRVKSTFPG